MDSLYYKRQRETLGLPSIHTVEEADSTLCAEHELIVFVIGLRISAQLMLELQQNAGNRNLPLWPTQIFSANPSVSGINIGYKAKLKFNTPGYSVSAITKSPYLGVKLSLNRSESFKF